MKKAPVMITLIVVLLVLAGVGIYIVNKQQPTATPTAMPSMSQPNQSQTQNTQPSSSSEVSIQNFAFSPTVVTIKKGTPITWTNNDAATHTVTESDDKKGPNSPPLAKNQTYSFTFKEAGVFAYKCTVHPSMTGTITVTD